MSTRAASTKPAAPKPVAAAPASPQPRAEVASATLTTGLRIQRLAEDEASASAAPYGTIVDDGLAVGPGQMSRTAFLDWVLGDVEKMAAAELAKIDSTVEDCPYLTYWVQYYRDKPAARVERAIQRYAQPTSTDPEGLAAAVLARSQRAVQLWVASGRVDAPSNVQWMGQGDGLDEPDATE